MTYQIKICHGEKSRITNKIIEDLKGNDFFKITSIKTPLHQRKDEEHIYEHLINFKGTYQPETGEKLKVLRNEIIAAIPELFPINYLFKFVDDFSNFGTYGYKHEFTCYGIDEGSFLVFAKIKEQKAASKPLEGYSVKV